MASTGCGLLISKHSETEIQSTMWIQKCKPEAVHILNKNDKQLLIKKGIFHCIQFSFNCVTSLWAAVAAVLWGVEMGSVSLKCHPRTECSGGKNDPTQVFGQTAPL